MEAHPPPPQKHTTSFWLVFLSLCLLSFVTALPKIWIANSFTIAQTIVQPFLAQLCDIYGRRNPILISVALFLLGSGLAGGASTVGQLISGRTVQGLGSGGIYILVDLIVCDLVPQRERGQYLGIALSLAAVGAVLGPVLGGALAQANWRWVFYLNLPLAGPVLLFMLFFLRLDAPQSSSSNTSPSIHRIDWPGNILFAGSILSQLLALVGGGTLHPWTSPSTLVPLIIGIIGWILFHIFEALPPKYCPHPCIPPHLFSTRNSLLGFILAFDAALLMQWTLYFLPIYFQGVQRKSPLTSGIDLLPYSAFLIPFAMVAGTIMSRTGLCRPLHFTGFAALSLALGLFTLLSANSPRAAWVCVQLPAALGQGFLATTILPAIQSSLGPADTASSTGVYAFLQSLAFVWGSTAPGIVFNARVDVYAWRIIDDETLRERLLDGRAGMDMVQREQVREVYRLALRTVWLVGLAFALVWVVGGFEGELEENGYGLREKGDVHRDEEEMVVDEAVGEKGGERGLRALKVGLEVKV
ncbi:MFS general substrate transporter [Aspergillus eucalypticola CBS 122712]|uniref:MFS general substrate transporter n=1 Tax=Aspergillus eucalypticola (strain CBS 122712 / IBT 29274) TaxID=1448314 RepID=A0A317V1M4_ASPEC|nr:MFS general substrate transporter [Aspergillus eucalypticola CBS 122712]PWY68224.1 MFS general substrate transporter [Aspergillus eucalypticola CBS 122712]